MLVQKPQRDAQDQPDADDQGPIKSEPEPEPKPGSWFSVRDINFFHNAILQVHVPVFVEQYGGRNRRKTKKSMTDKLEQESEGAGIAR